MLNRDIPYAKIRLKMAYCHQIFLNFTWKHFPKIRITAYFLYLNVALEKTISFFLLFLVLQDSDIYRYHNQEIDRKIVKLTSKTTDYFYFLYMRYCIIFQHCMLRRQFSIFSSKFHLFYFFDCFIPLIQEKKTSKITLSFKNQKKWNQA